MFFSFLACTCHIVALRFLLNSVVVQMMIQQAMENKAKREDAREARVATRSLAERNTVKLNAHGRQLTIE